MYGNLVLLLDLPFSYDSWWLWTVLFATVGLLDF